MAGVTQTQRTPPHVGTTGSQLIHIEYYHVIRKTEMGYLNLFGHDIYPSSPLKIFNLNAPIPYLSFEERLHTISVLFALDQNPTGSPTRRHESDDALSEYQELCLRVFFLVRGNICAQGYDLAHNR